MDYSFIIPTLNEEKLLPGLLDTLNNPILKKRFPFEIIVSDGASTDSTVDIAKGKCDILIIHSGKDRQNIPEGRNAGAESARGDILIFVNADIRFADPGDFLQYIESNFKTSAYCAMTCMVKVFPWEEKTIDKMFHRVYNSYFRLMNSVGVGMGRGECQIIRRKVFESLKGYNEKLAAGEDFDLFRRAKKMGKILFADDLYVYESPRRYRKFGYKKVTFTWMKNGLSVLFKNKSYNKEWEQVR